MIVELLSLVTGKRLIDDDVLFTHRLQFLPGVEAPKIVIVPKKDAPLGAQRVLKIVADTIDTGSGLNAQITYNLDGDFTLPIVDTGLDPVTKAKNGDKGTPDYSPSLGGIIPADTAEPNYSILDPLHYVGNYPKANSGGDGESGGKGGSGAEGIDAPVLEIWTKEILGDGLTIDLRGQEGGDGGPGGIGQRGGDGQGGSAQSRELRRTGWVFPMLSVRRDPVWAEMVAEAVMQVAAETGGMVETAVFSNYSIHRALPWQNSPPRCKVDMEE